MNSSTNYLCICFFCSLPLVLLKSGFFKDHEHQPDKLSFHKSDMFLERSNTDSVGSGIDRRRDTRSSIRKRDLTSSEQLRIIENHNHTVNFPIPQDNPSLQSMQTNYRSMQNVQAEHAPSLQSMYSAQTSFEKYPTRDISQNLNMSDRNKESLQSLRNNICMDEYSPHSRLRKTSQTCSNPSQSLSKLSVSSSLSKPNTPTTEPGTRQIPCSISQSLTRGQNPGQNLASSVPEPSSKCQNMHCSSSQGYQMSQLSQPDILPTQSADQHSQQFSVGFAGYPEQLQNPFSPEEQKVPLSAFTGSSCLAQSIPSLASPTPETKPSPNTQNMGKYSSHVSQPTQLDFHLSQGSNPAKPNSDTQ